jgi:hypothetical protein
MNLKQQFAAEDVEWRRHEHDGRIEFAAEFGPQGDSSADVVGNTLIVVAGGEQYEFDVDPDARAFINNGVLTVEVNE